jgi:hypothetical protein
VESKKAELIEIGSRMVGVGIWGDTGLKGQSFIWIRGTVLENYCTAI